MVKSSLARLWHRLSRTAPRRQPIDHYNAIFEQAVIGIVETTASGHIIRLNTALARMLGYDSASQAQGYLRQWRDLYADQNDYEQMRTQLGAEQTIAALTCELRCQDGSAIWGTQQIFPLSQDDNGGTVYLCQVENIDAYKTIEAALAYEKSQMDSLLNSVADSIYFKDRECRLTRVSRKLERDFQLRGEGPILGKTDEELFHPELGEITVVEEKRIMETGEPVIGKVEYWTEGTHSVWATTIKAPWRDAQGEIVGIVGITRDFTDIMSAREEVRKTGEATRRFLEKLKQLHEVGISLSQTGSFDNLCRQVVEQGQGLLDFDRIGMWFVDSDDPDYAYGSFGIDEDGDIRDERKCRIHIDPGSLWREVTNINPIRYQDDYPLRDNSSEQVGYGPKAVALLADGKTTLGWLVADNLLSQTPMSHDQLELFKLFSVTVSHLCTRERAEAALKREKALLDSLMNNVTDSIYFKDRESRLIRISRKMEQNLLRDGIEAYLGKTDHDLFGEEFGAITRRDDKQVMDTGEPIIGLIEQRETPDRVKWTSTTKAPLTGANGEVVGLVGVTREINEIMEAREALRENEAKALAFQESLRKLHEISIIMSQAVSFDELCRLAVEHGRDLVEFDRIGLWFIDLDDPAYMVGSFGVDEQGQFRDERGHRLPIRGGPLFSSVDSRSPISYRGNYRLFNHEGQEIGEGPKAVSLLLDGNEIIGWLAADNLISRQPMTSDQIELLRLFSATVSHLCTRKRAEDALRNREEAARDFQGALRKLHEVSINLSQAETFDDLCRQVVEWGHDLLGFDRLGMWLIDPVDPENVRGTFGIDAAGNIQDNRQRWLPYSTMDDAALHLDSRTTLELQTDVPLYNSDQELVGHGQRAAVLLLDGETPIGWIFADNLIHRQSMAPDQLELFSLYGNMVGHLCKRKQTEDALRNREEAARDFQGALRQLHEVSIRLSQAETFDDLCRQVVERGRDLLGVDRLGMWLIDPADPDNVHGAFSIDATGNIQDDRQRTVPYTDMITVASHIDNTIAHSSQMDILLYNSKREVVDQGQRAVVLLLDGETPIGWIFADNLIHPHTVASDQLELFSLYGSMVGHLCKRKQTEDVLRDREESARVFQEQLRILHEVSIELTKAKSFDELCYQAVKLGLAKLGFDRLGLWFLDEDDPTYMVGSYGTDEHGNIRDERHERHKMWGEMLGRISSDEHPIIFDEYTELRDARGEFVARGDLVTATLWDGDRAIGWVLVDNLRFRKPFTQQQREIVRLFSLTLGHLCTRNRVEEALQENQAYLREIIDSNPNHIFVMDGAGRYLLMNKQMAEFHGTTIEASIGKTMGDILRMDADVIQRLQAENAEAISRKKRAFVPDMMAMSAAGKPHHFQVAKIPITLRGNPDCLLGVAVDITDRKRAEAQRIELARERESVRVLQRFISGAAHDLITPLTTMKTSLYLMRRTAEDNKLLQRVDVLDQQASHIESSIQSLLKMARLDRTAFYFERLDMDRLVEDVALEQQQLQRADVNPIVVDAVGGEKSVLVDHEEFKFVVRQLLNNAIAYSKPDTEITLRTEIQDEMGVLLVIDQGEGISPDDMPHIYEPFYRAEAREIAKGGVGLGLTIAKWIVEAHGGAISAESTLGAGSTFRVTLPIVREDMAIEG